MSKDKILVVDDEPKVGWIFSKILEDEYEVLSADSGREGLALARKEKPALVFVDLRLPDISGIQFLQEIRKSEPGLLVIMLTAYESVPSAVEAMKLGAYDYLTKPIPNDRLKIIIKNALETAQLAKKVKVLERKLEKRCLLEEIKGTSPPMQTVFDLIRRVARHDVNVLLVGETGTGKEMVARAIHEEGDRRENPFVPVDASAIPETLMESELFGHEKGAFTGAVSAHPGKFELAQGGTLFLDEIGNLTRAVQGKLLRVIQERELIRLGGTKTIRVTVRLIAATNRDLSAAVKAGEFREDLYHRVNVFPIHLPPLRERGEDKVLLSRYFLQRFSEELGKSVKGLSHKAEEILSYYPWPGNVRELENTIKHALLMTVDGEQSLLPEHLPESIRSRSSVHRLREGNSLWESSREAAAKVEKEVILKTLRETNWNKRKTAQFLKIDYKTLFNKLKEYDIPTRPGVPDEYSETVSRAKKR